LLLFESRLLGEPIGISVVGMFVITRSLILTLLGIFVTYFFLLAQLHGKA
ncbi:hypothetical protein TrispH2_010362, partial [Trichoplax sp. H2]